MSNSTSRILSKILWKGKGRWLLFGAGFGSFLGLVLLLSTVQFYLDITRLLAGDANPGDQYIQINKKVNLLNAIGVKASFTEEDIANIQNQTFVESVGKFTPSGFKASATSDMLGFYTELFFESVPKDYLDVDEPGFRWVPGQQEIPVLISRDYLALYNFGFAPSQGLPQLTPSTISKLNMDVRLSGVGKEQVFNGKIVGFSDRINSILVPNEFMEWANAEFGVKESTSSRLILKVKNPLDKGLQTFLKENGYEVSTGRLIGSQFGVLLRLVLAVVWGLGLLILTLSLLIFILNFQLLIAQGRPDIRLLLETGHFPKQISAFLNLRFTATFVGVLLFVFLALVAIRFWQHQYFENQGFKLDAGLSSLVWGIGFALGAILLAVNLLNIHRSVMKES